MPKKKVIDSKKLVKMVKDETPQAEIMKAFGFKTCVFRCIVTTHSAANCPLIPLDCDHPFRNIVTTHSAGL